MINAEHDEDLGLIARIVRKEEAALRQLYERYERPVYTFAYRMVKTPMLAEEVVQELFLRIWNSAHQYDAKQGKWTSWMFTLVRNIAIDLLRRRQERTSFQTVDSERLAETSDTAPGTAEAAEANVLGEQVRDAVNHLNPDQKQVLELIYYEGFTQQEVSDRCRIPLGTVKSRVRLALKTLQHSLAASEREEVGR